MTSENADNRKNKIIDLLKEENGYTTRELISVLNCSMHTIQDDIRHLREVDGIPIKKIGWRYKIDRDQYYVSMNSFNIKLNMSEVFILLAPMYNRVKYDEYLGPIYLSIMQKFYNQLSDRAKNVINRNNLLPYSSNGDDTPFRTEREMFENYHNSIIFSMMKDPTFKVNITFRYKGDELNKDVSIKDGINGKLILIDSNENRYEIEAKDIITLGEIKNFR